VKPSELGGFPRVVVIALGVLASGLSTRLVAAEDVALDGLWSMATVSESFVVQQWGAPCGPAPVSGTMLQESTVAIRGEGGELIIAGEQRMLRTDECLDPMPSLSRGAHSHDGRSWRTRCSTPPSDPRRAVVNTAFFLAPGDDTISVAETGRYEFTINDGRCVADVKRATSLLRLAHAPASARRSGSPVPLEKAVGGAPPKIDCSAPGDPARLEVRPSRKLMRLGETFAFRGVVVDANGCPTGTAIQWTIGTIAFNDRQQHGGRVSIDGAGRLSVPETDFTDATFDVVAAAAGRAARASVEATSAASYEALLAQSGLDSKGERGEPAVAVLATTSIGASRARAEDGASRRRTMFVVVVGGLALVLGMVAAIGALRARRVRQAERVAEQQHAEKMREYERQKRDREQQHADQMRAHVESIAIAQQQAAAAVARGIDSGPSFCPSCRREFAGGTVFCPFDANRLVAIAGHEELLAAPTGGICPTCKRGFNPGVRVCPHDGDELLPPAVAEAQSGASAPPPRGKICPTCGGRFDGTAGFCGKDGTQLVLLN
jgi:hypothetical protein